MGDKLKYTLPAMEQAHADITLASTNFEQIHADVTSLMTQLQAAWAGNAQDAWNCYQAAWNTIFADVTAELASLGAAVDQCRQNSAAAEDANHSMWRS
jgi:WXG100 family type VII secretion target